MLDWFNLHLEIEQTFLRSECDGDGCGEELMLTCKRSELNELLIGKNHVFNPIAKWNTEGRTECRFRIWMRRRSKLSEKAIKAMELGSDSVGKLQFWKEQDALDALVFVEDAMFERWCVVFLSMRHKMSATITIALDQNFSERRTVGDESHVTWNVAEEAAVSEARIRNWARTNESPMEGVRLKITL